MQIDSLLPLTKSRMKAQELLLLLNDIKPLLRHGYYEHEFPKIEQFCQQYSLHLVKSPFKVLLDDNNQFTNRGLRLPGSDPRPGLFFIYISKDEKTAHLALLSELQNNHHQLGELLDYPKCCIQFFINQFNDQQNSNPQHPPTNPWTNLTKRQQDYCLLSHFPCSSDCKKSITLAKTYYQNIQQENPTYAQELLTKLTP